MITKIPFLASRTATTYFARDPITNLSKINCNDAVVITFSYLNRNLKIVRVP